MLPQAKLPPDDDDNTPPDSEVPRAGDVPFTPMLLLLIVLSLPLWVLIWWLAFG